MDNTREITITVQRRNNNEQSKHIFYIANYDNIENRIGIATAIGMAVEKLYYTINMNEYRLIEVITDEL